MDQMERLPHRAPVLRPVAVAPGKGGWLLPRHAPGAAPAVQRKGVPADQKRRHPGSGAAASGPDHLRGPGHGPAGRAGAVPNAPYAYWMLQEVIRNEELTLEERSGAVSELEKLAKGGDRYSQYLLGKLWRDGPLLIPDG